MMVIVLEGMVAIIPQLTQQLKSGSLFSIISELTATLLNPKMRVLMKTTLCSGKLENRMSTSILTLAVLFIFI